MNIFEIDEIRVEILKYTGFLELVKLGCVSHSLNRFVYEHTPSRLYFDPKINKAGCLNQYKVKHIIVDIQDVKNPLVPFASDMGNAIVEIRNGFLREDESMFIRIHVKFPFVTDVYMQKQTADRVGYVDLNILGLIRIGRIWEYVDFIGIRGSFLKFNVIRHDQFVTITPEKTEEPATKKIKI